MDAQLIVHKNPHPADFLKLPHRQVMVPVSRVNEKPHFLKRTAAETSQPFRVFVPTGKRVIVIVKLLAERELSSCVDSGCLGVLHKETFWLFWKLNCTLAHPLKFPFKTRGVRGYGQDVIV